MDFIAKEKYGIKEYQDVNINQNNQIKKSKEKKNSLKKIEIYEKGIVTDKTKYEREIKNNENIINDLINEKNKLLFYYKELIGEEQFRNIINNFKEEEKNKNKSEEINSEEKEDINTSNTLNINRDFITNINKDELLILKNNENNGENTDIKDKNNNNKENQFPQFLDFFKEEQNKDNDINNNNNNESNTSVKDINNINKSEDENNSEIKEKEIIMDKFDEINILSDRNKQNEEEPPPNEYEELEEFQI